MRALTRILAVLLVGFLCLSSPACAQDTASIPEVAAAELPAQARATIELIRKGGPYPFERDGLVFGNFEQRLPVRGRGYYREYTVRTPGAKSRGARRVVAGQGGELYYTEDHYQTFKRIKQP